MFLNYILLFQD